MKFLIFNIVVAAALVFLFAGDKGDLTAVAHKAERVVSGLRAKTVGTAAPRPTRPGVAESAEAKVPAPQTKPASEKAGTAKPEPKVPPPAPDTKQVAEETEPRALPKVEVATHTPAPPLSPEVEKRRAEILDDGGATVAEGTAGKFMPADIRRRELMLLSEEMELFSAEAVSR